MADLPEAVPTPFDILNGSETEMNRDESMAPKELSLDQHLGKLFEILYLFIYLIHLVDTGFYIWVLTFEKYYGIATGLAEKLTSNCTSRPALNYLRWNFILIYIKYVLTKKKRVVGREVLDMWGG